MADNLINATCPKRAGRGTIPMRRIIAALAALMLIAGPAAAGSGFTDIADSVHRADIEWLAAEGITKGCTATRYCPGDWTERGQMVAFIRRAGAYPVVDTWDRYIDDDASIFEPEINALSERGVVDECARNARGDALFCPVDRTTRRTMVRWLFNTDLFASVVYAQSPFSDVDPSDPDYVAISSLYAAGVLRGHDGKAFIGQAVTREQMASFLRRVYDPAYGNTTVG